MSLHYDDTEVISVPQGPFHVMHARMCRWYCWVECFATAAARAKTGVHV